MIVNLIKPSRMFSLTLPQRVKGQYWITDIDEKGNTRNLVSIEAHNEKWVAKSNRSIKIIKAEGAEKVCVNETVLTNESFLYLELENEEEYVLFTEEISLSRQTLVKIVVNEPQIITIGRTEDNCICYRNPFVSGRHATIAYDGEQWSIKDERSKNGTYVNSHRVSTRKLNPSEFIFIMGLRIVIGQNFFAVNNPDNNVKIRSNVFSLYKPQQFIRRTIDVEGDEKTYFYRSPRFFHEVKSEVITIDSPPQPQKLDTVPTALMLGPSITMGMTSVSTGILSASNLISSGGNIRQALPTLIMSGSMLLGTILWPVLTKKYEKKQRIKAEKDRHTKYLEYLNDVSDRIKRIGKEQSDILNETLVPKKDCIDRIIFAKTNLWERMTSHSDFLRLRLGTGSLPMDVEVNYQEQKFSIDEDTLQNAMLALAEEPKRLEDVPVSFKLTDSIATGIYGNKQETSNLVKALIIEMIALHSYDELKIMLLVDKNEADEWSFVKYIPHFWSNDKSYRFFASSVDDARELSSYLDANVLNRKPDDRNPEAVISPFYVIISLSNELTKKSDGIKKLLQKTNVGCSLIVVCAEISEFPKETRKVIYANGIHSKIYDNNDISGKSTMFAADRVNEDLLDEVSRRIANIEMDIIDQSYKMPNMLTFFDMFKVGKVEHLNSLSRWKENNPTKTLQTPVGVDAFGDPFTLDIHEKFHGPHGLVAGMTGSGKSEFLITYILSLSVNYHPNEVAFILIDYKGGGLAGAFEDKEKGTKLPHLAGVITNLDGAAINRTLVSFQSERRRREDLLNKARRIANEGTMDIYKYQQLYRDGIVSEPLPHLIIIADEFAELKQQQLDFMDQLISLARVGRSLGIHLILATQKPSGVVDEQIWSNSKFRVCLKVQEKADSQEMIKRPDAAEIAQTGRFYLQVGFNELFALGQSAWCGAEYLPSDTVRKQVDTSIQVIDNLGRTVVSAKQTTGSAIKTNTVKQIVATVDYLTNLAEEEGVSARSLWLDPLPEKIYLDEVERKYSHKESGFVLEPVVGEYDDPFNQRQDKLTIPLSAEGNCLIYGSPGNGKEMLLTSLCCSLIKHHSAEELNLYILDFGSETLKVFENAPQVGGVVISSENEKLVNLFNQLKKEIESRKTIFSQFGGDYAGYCKSGHTDIPNIVVILNNYSFFVELYEDYQDDLNVLSRDGVNYGIYFVVTAGTTNAVRYKTQQNFKMMMTMQLNDAADYSVIVGKTDGLVPSKLKGRGLVALDKPYEFQTALCTKEDDQHGYLLALCSRLSNDTQSRAKRIPVLPSIVDFGFIKSDIGGFDRIPIGVAKRTMETAFVDITTHVLYPVLCQEIADAENFGDVLADVLAESGRSMVIDSEKLLHDPVGLVKPADYEEAVLQIYDDMAQRHNTYKDANLDIGALSGFDELAVMIVGGKKFVDMLGKETKGKFCELIEKAKDIYKIHFVVIDSVSQFQALGYEAGLKNAYTGSDGIWIGDGITDQYVIKLNKVTSDLYDETERDYGYLIKKNRLRLVKLLSQKEE